MLLVLSACGGGGSDVSAPPAVTGVTITPSGVTLQGVGATGTVSGAIAPSNATGSISWRSDGPSIATVSGSGSSATITAVGAGTTTIVASVGGVSGSTSVTVVPIVRAISASSTSAAVAVGATATLSATLTADAGASTALDWSSSVPTVASINATGVVTGLSPGTSAITVASVAFPAISTTIAVTVAYPVVRSVTVTLPSPSVLVGTNQQLTATVDANNGTAQTVVWSTSASAVASVSASGVVAAIAPGAATITATSTANPTVFGTAMVTVRAPTVRTIAVMPNAPSVVVGATQQFVTTIDADVGANASVTWTSSDVGIATVNATGLVTTLAPGNTTIRATSTLVPTVSGQATLTVFIPPLVNGWQQRPLSLPATDLLYDVDQLWSASASLAFGIGFGDDGERRVLRWDGTAWSYLPLAPFDNLTALGGTGSEVLLGNSAGRIARYTTSAVANPGFTEMAVPPLGCIRKIAAAGASAAVALASTTSNCFTSRAVLVYQGGSWVRLPDPTALTTVLDITASSPTNIVAVGLGGTRVQRWDGVAWSSVTTPSSAGTAQSVAMLGADLVVVTGASESARLVGANWTSISAPTPRPNAGGLFLTRLTVCGGQLYVGTTIDGRVFRLDGTAWTQIASYGVAVPGSYATQATCGVDTVLRVGGTDGGIGRYTGSAWVWEAASPYLFKAVIIRPDLAYAVGGSGVVERWNGVQWQVELAVSSFGYLDKLSATDDGLVLASGAGAPTGLWRRQGGTWSFDALSYTPAAIWGATSNFALSLAASAASRFDGNAWVSIPPPPSFNPLALDGLSSVFAIVVGGASGASSGRAFKWTGTAFEAMTLPGGVSNITTVKVVSASLAYALTSANALLRYDGTQWSAMSGPSTSNNDLPLRSIAATGPSDVYVLSATGALFHFNGSAWERLANFPTVAGVSPYFTSLAIKDGMGLITGAGGLVYHGANGANFIAPAARRR